MFLDTTSKKLQIVLAGAVTTNELPWHVAYGEVASDNSTSAPKGNHGLTTGGTAVDMVAAPGASLVRELLHFSVQNADTAAATVTVRVNDGGTARVIVKATLAVGDQLLYDIHAGWRVLDANGNTKGSGSGGSSSNALLDGSAHTDTVSASVAQGSLIVGNATPKWDVVTIGAAHRFLQSNGTTAGWVALSGDATLAAGAITIANNAVTYAKIQDVSATSRILGRKTAGSGDPEECTLSEVLDFVGSAAHGDVLYRGAATWARLAAGTSGQFLQTQGAGANPQWAAASGSATMPPVIVTPLANEPPSSNYATLDLRNSHPVLDFDAATAESAIFSAILPRAYAGGGLTVRLWWMATSATSGNVKWNAAIERMDTGTDLDSDSFASDQTTTTTTSGTSGAPVSTDIAFTSGAQMDSLAAGEAFRLRVKRDAADAADTMTGDAELLAVEIKET